MMNGGIDQQIQQKVDAYRGKPEALQQRYAQNKQLIDLLALQKLKSEKDAAARDMAMQMQQQPSTIKQQLESEMVQRTKDDMAKQLGGIMQKKQADQQKRASQMGIAANPAPNMAGMNMASGGIVGYAAGDLVDAEDASLAGERRRRYEELKSRRRGFLSPAEIDELAALERSFGGEGGQGREAVGEFISEAFASKPEPRPAEEIMTVGTGTASGTIEEMNAERPQTIEEVVGAEAVTAPTPQSEGLDRLEERTAEQEVDGGAPVAPPPAQGPTGIQALAMPQTAIGIPDRKGKSQIVAPKADYTKSDAMREKVMPQLEQDVKLDVEAGEEAAYERALERVGYSQGDKALRQKRIDELEAIRAKRMDPEELRKERARAFLQAGSRATGGVGGVLGRAAMGANAARKQAQEAELGLLGLTMGAEKGLMDDTAAQRAKASEQAFTKAGQLETRRSQGIKDILGLSKTEAEKADKYADRLLSADVANLEAEDRDRAMELKSVLNLADRQTQVLVKNLEAAVAMDKNDVQRAMAEAETATQIQKVVTDAESALQKIRSAYVEMFADRVDQIRLMAGGSEKKKAEAEAMVKALMQQRNAIIAESTAGLRGMVDEMRARIGQTGIPRRTGN